MEVDRKRQRQKCEREERQRKNNSENNQSKINIDNAVTTYAVVDRRKWAACGMQANEKKSPKILCFVSLNTTTRVESPRISNLFLLHIKN